MIVLINMYVCFVFIASVKHVYKSVKQMRSGAFSLCSVTRYGHQDTVTAVDSLSRERAVTSGGRDGSVRIWKVIEESQLVFHGHT